MVPPGSRPGGCGDEGRMFSLQCTSDPGVVEEVFQLQLVQLLGCGSLDQSVGSLGYG